jgi:hypothetical protein
MSSSTSTQQVNTSRRSQQIAFLKVVAFTALVLDLVFHWLEAPSWMGLLAFLLDGVEVANQNLHGSVITFMSMRFISVLAHAAFLLGLLALLVAPLNRAPGHPMSGITQVIDLPFNGRGRWVTYASIAALAILGVMLLGLSLKGTGVI